ncbi:CERS1_2_3_4 [Mytilus edulis]|uniref:CERS1_2_3_4 n=1 Tax=Mytilus edulis TaxID=6550 RepID=A0A8S3TVI2_MYTED|nr:CERS1_2_3_4 [Mytilus edulis]
MMDWLNGMINRLQPDLFRPEDLQSLPPDEYVPKLSDIVLPSIFLAVLFIIIRHLLDGILIKPIGTYFHVNDTVSKENVPPIPVLEAGYKVSRNPKPDAIMSLAKKSEMTVRQVEIWFRKRKKQDKVTDMKRLEDASWQFIFYFIMSWYGIYVLWDKPWFTKSVHCWTGYPTQQTVSDGIYWYYLLELAFYISSIVTICTDHKRKDFVEMSVHHIVTILLIGLSWNYNAVRVGTLVICIHDPVDYILAFAKMSNYCKYIKVSDLCFVLFAVVWIATRLIIYPYMVLYSVTIELPEYANNSGPHEQYYGNSFVMQLLKVMLGVLQILHIFWSILIARTAATKFTQGQLQDVRSDSENSEKEDESSHKHHTEDTSHMNGHIQRVKKIS